MNKKCAQPPGFGFNLNLGVQGWRFVFGDIINNTIINTRLIFGGCWRARASVVQEMGREWAWGCEVVVLAGCWGGREGDVRGGRTSSRQLSNAARSKFLQGTSASFFFHHARAKNRNGVGS